MEEMILLEPAHRASMGRKGQEKVVRKFDEGIVIEAYREVVSEVLV